MTGWRIFVSSLRLMRRRVIHFFTVIGEVEQETDPLNVLQAELLYRSRLTEEQGKSPDPRVEQALMVTIAGVAAGMRNTG